MREMKLMMQSVRELHATGNIDEKTADSKLLIALGYELSNRMREARANGKHGWWNPDVCSIEFLKEQAIKNFGEGNVLDAIIFSAMVLMRNECQTSTLIFDTSTLGKLTELAPRHCAFFEEVYSRIMQVNFSFELATPTTKAIMIAGKMIEQAMNEIERLNPHKESFSGELSPSIENMIHDIGMEVDDMKHIILAAQAETKEQMYQALEQSTGRFEKEIADWEPTK